MWKGRDNGADLALPTWDPRLSLSPRLLGESKNSGTLAAHQCSEDVGTYQKSCQQNIRISSIPLVSYRSNPSGSHSYPVLLKKSHRVVGRTDGSSSGALQTHVILISSRIPAYEVHRCARSPALSWGAFFPHLNSWNLLAAMCVKMIHLLKGKLSNQVNLYKTTYSFKSWKQ